MSVASTETKQYKHPVVPIWKSTNLFTEKDWAEWRADGVKMLHINYFPPEEIISFEPDPDDPNVFVTRSKYSEQQIADAIKQQVNFQLSYEYARLDKELPIPVYAFTRYDDGTEIDMSVVRLKSQNLNGCLAESVIDNARFFVQGMDFKLVRYALGLYTDVTFGMLRPEVSEEEVEDLKLEPDHEKFLELTTPLGDYVREVYGVW